MPPDHSAWEKWNANDWLKKKLNKRIINYLALQESGEHENVQEVPLNTISSDSKVYKRFRDLLEKLT